MTYYVQRVTSLLCVGGWQKASTCRSYETIVQRPHTCLLWTFMSSVAQHMHKGDHMMDKQDLSRKMAKANIARCKAWHNFTSKVKHELSSSQSKTCANICIVLLDQLGQCLVMYIWSACNVFCCQVHTGQVNISNERWGTIILSAYPRWQPTPITNISVSPQTLWKAH